MPNKKAYVETGVSFPAFPDPMNVANPLDPATGLPVPLVVSGGSGSGAVIEVPDHILHWTKYVDGSSWQLVANLQNRCNEVITMPLIAVLCYHNTATSVVGKMDLFIDYTSFVANLPWGSCNVSASMSAGWNVRQINDSTPSGLPRQGSSARLEAVGWKYAKLYLAHTTAGYKDDVEFYLCPNFMIEEFVGP